MGAIVLLFAAVGVDCGVVVVVVVGRWLLVEQICNAKRNEICCCAYVIQETFQPDISWRMSRHRKENINR
eukprot:3166766-Amphidinium_carterae.1